MTDETDQVFRPRDILSVTGITGVVYALLGLLLFCLGMWLAAVGGSWYYWIAGACVAASGVLTVMRREWGIWLYAIALGITVLWALFEVGFDGWKLLPRVFMPAILGIWLFLPFVSMPAGLNKSQAWIGSGVCLLLAVLVIVLGYTTTAASYHQFEKLPQAAPVAVSDPLVPNDQWRYYGRTPDGDRYSPLTQITPDNVRSLKAVWTFRTGDLPSKADTEKGKEFNFEATPIKVGNTLYLCTGHEHVISIDATTGAKRWEYDPHGNTEKDIFHSCRGVAYADTPASRVCPARIISPTGDPRLVALNAETGQPCSDFGKDGFIDLTDHMGIVPPGFQFISSQPMVMNGRLITGGWIYDNEAEGEPSGVVRAYDPVTGQLAWAWDLGRPDPTAPLKPGETYTRGTPNAWGTYTADPALGLVYLPLGNATPDYYDGNRRPFDNEYSSSVVALDAATGKERWHYQTVHLDMWDFDLPIGPSLVDLTIDGANIPALVQTTKRGEFFVLDRRNGRPLTGIVEKPVPQNPAPGEQASATQPYPMDFPSLAPKDLTAADTWGATPIDQILCRIDFHTLRYNGQFTPPTVGGYIAYPAFDGVVDWYGASIDPARKLLIANASYVPFHADLVPQPKAIKKGITAPWAGWGHPFPPLISVANNPQYGTPYTIVLKPWLGLFGAPCFAPPWGRLVAIDLNTRKIAWERRIGDTSKTNLFNLHVNAPLPTGIFNMGGNVITASGLIFVAGTADDKLRAFDERTGKTLWQVSLPAGGNATPSIYQGADGRQYVVICAGGHGGLKTKTGDYVIAYALPRA